MFLSLSLSAGFSAHKSSPLLSPPASSLPLFSVHTRSDPEALECCWLVAATPKQTLVPQPAVWATIRYCSNRSQCVCVCAWLHAFIAFNSFVAVSVCTACKGETLWVCGDCWICEAFTVTRVLFFNWFKSASAYLVSGEKSSNYLCFQRGFEVINYSHCKLTAEWHSKMIFTLLFF